MASKEKREEDLKKLLVLLGTVSAFTTYAQTTNWYVDGTLYQTTSCTSGDNVTPPTAPAKHGYTFAGWFDANLVIGSGIQYGTPSPTNPIYPTFYQDDDLILRAVDTDNKLIADTYNTETGKITRRIGVKVLKGTESWQQSTASPTFKAYLKILDSAPREYQLSLCSHFQSIRTDRTVNVNDEQAAMFKETSVSTYDNLVVGKYDTADLTAFKQWLADQYAAGTPVTIYYPLKTPTEEIYTPAQ